MKCLTKEGAHRLKEAMEDAWHRYRRELDAAKGKVEVRMYGHSQEFYSVERGGFLFYDKEVGVPQTQEEWRVVSTWVQYYELTSLCSRLNADWRRSADGKHDVFPNN